MAVLSTLQGRALWSGTECRHTGGVNREFTPAWGRYKVGHLCPTFLVMAYKINMAVFVGHKCPTYNNCAILFTKMSASRRRAIAHLVSGCLSNAIPKDSLKKKNRLVFSQTVFC